MPVPGKDRSVNATALTTPRENPDGVDRTLIRTCLRMTPSERIAMLVGWSNSMADLADAATSTKRK